MIQHSTHIRVRYAETDQMGVVYHGNYIPYFEAGRAEFIRSLGLSYAEMEAIGVIMPVTELRVRYMRPATYDALLEIRTTLRELPGKRITMESSVFNEAGKLCAEGFVTLAFLDAATRKSVAAPEAFLDILKENWEAEKGE